MKAQALQSNHQQHMISKKTLELNPEHRIIQEMVQRCSEQDKHLRDLVRLLYDTALLTSGFSIPKPDAYAQRIHRLIAIGLSVDSREDEQVLVQESKEEVVDSTESVMEQVD